MNFSECIAEVSLRLKVVHGRILDKHESAEADFSSWWFTFTRSGCLYRIYFIGRTCTVTLDKGQGSFVVGSKTKWIPLNSVQASGEAFETVLPGIDSLLKRFSAEAPAPRPHS